MFLAPLKFLTVVVIGFASLSTGAAAELHPIDRQTPRLVVTQQSVGVDSQLKPNQWARITDAETWQRVWQSHQGLMSASNTDDFESIDFARSMVIAIVDKTDRKTAGIRVDNISVDDEIVFFDYQWIKRTDEKRNRRSNNAYGFFVIPRSERQVVVRRLFKGNQDDPEYKVVASLEAIGGNRKSSPDQHGKTPRRNTLPRSLNVTFADDPGNGQHDGRWGMPDDAWNLVNTGTTEKGTLRYADMTVSPIRMRITNHDGAWGIQGHTGIFHGYIYHNCQCVDLEATLLGIPSGRYRALVYAHGNAPNQNARIELLVGDRSLGMKSTANDGSWRFRELEFKEGVHYVKFTFEVKQGDVVKFISHRDGSGYSLFNAIQIEPDER